MLFYMSKIGKNLLKDTFLLEKPESIDWIFGVYIHGTLGSIIGNISLTFYIIKDYLCNVK